MKKDLRVRNIQKKTQTLNARQIQFLDFVMLNQKDLDNLVYKSFEENPTIEILDGYEGNPVLVFDDILNSYITEHTIKDDLYQQLLWKPHLNYDVMAYLIESIDVNGFISNSESNLARELGVNESLVEYSLSELRKFHPRGIASQSVKDNLITQLNEVNDSVSILAADIIRNFLSKNTYNESSIKKWYEIDDNQLDEALARIHSCRPTFEMGGQDMRIQIPDLIIRTEDGTIVCETVRNYSKIKINYDYVESKDPKIKEWYRESKTLLDNVHFRNVTLLKIANEIVEQQYEFFLSQKPLKAITLSTIAENLELSISTVSRVVKNKNVLLNNEVYSLADFFVSSTKSGQSSDMIKKRILSIIQNETEPNSDQTLVTMLNSEGIYVERRTVSKYRQELNIPSSTERRKRQKWD